MNTDLLKRCLALMALVAGLAVFGSAVSTRAADHADSPDTSEGNLDINDLYAFVDGDDLVLAMTVAPLLSPGEATNDAALNPDGIYQFNLDVERDGIADAVVQVVARGTGPDQTITVLGPTPVDGGANPGRILDGPRVTGAFGSTLTGGGMTVFVGPRDDPFYINLFGDESLTSVLNAVYSGALERQIGDPSEQTLAFADPAEDDLAGLNTLAIVVSIPRSMVGDVLGIGAGGNLFAWASTGDRT